MRSTRRCRSSTHHWPHSSIRHGRVKENRMSEDTQSPSSPGMDGRGTGDAADRAAALAAAQSYMQQGNEAAEKGEYETASAAFAEAVAADRTDARARYNLALARQQLSDYEGAIASYMRAIRLDPMLIEAYINLANLYSALEMFDDALEVFQRALDLDQGNADLYINVGDAYRELGFF